METELFLLVDPVGSVVATLPAGHGDGTFRLLSTNTSKPTAFSAAVASPTDLHATFGIGTFTPNARLLGGSANWIDGLPAMASRIVKVAALMASVAEREYSCACSPLC